MVLNRPMLAFCLSLMLSALALPDAYHERASAQFLEVHHLKGKTAADLDYERVVSENFVAAPLGLFEVRFPKGDLEKRSLELHKCALALLDAQQLLLDWTKESGFDQKALREDFKVLRKWVAGLKEGQLARINDTKGDWFAALHAPEAVSAAQSRLAEACGKGALLGVKRENQERLRLVLTPSRKSFVEFVSFAGWQDETNRGLFWVTGLWQWTSCTVRTDTVVALEYSSAGGTPDQYELGSPMNEQSPNTMEQQLVQLAMNALLERFCGAKLPQPLLQGISMNLVIQQFGIVNTRVDGDTRARQTQEREVFVRGGNSEGGELGKNFADSRWRELYGADHFLKILKAVQREGGEIDKRGTPKLTQFAIRDDKGAAPKAFSAPFYFPDARVEVPPAYAGDYDEFQRAYKSAFLHWLQNAGAGNAKQSAASFARWLALLADPASPADVFASLSQVYEGAPLSNAAADKDCLEGRFLIWLPKAKER